MQIQSNSSILNNNIPFKKGLYFAKTPYILFNKNLNFRLGENFPINI